MSSEEQEEQKTQWTSKLRKIPDKELYPEPKDVLELAKRAREMHELLRSIKHRKA